MFAVFEILVSSFPAGWGSRLCCISFHIFTINWIMEDLACVAEVHAVTNLEDVCFCWEKFTLLPGCSYGSNEGSI